LAAIVYKEKCLNVQDVGRDVICTYTAPAFHYLVRLLRL